MMGIARAGLLVVGGHASEFVAGTIWLIIRNNSPSGKEQRVLWIAQFVAPGKGFR